MNEIDQAAALVTCTVGGVRHVLLVDHWDGAGWAMPVSIVEPGETPEQAGWYAVDDQAGLYLLSYISWHHDEPRDGLVVARCNLGEVNALPEVQAGGAMRRAEWVPIYNGKVHVYEDRIFPAHRGILEGVQ